MNMSLDQFICYKGAEFTQSPPYIWSDAVQTAYDKYD